jgi:hypothetical protein
MPSSAPLYSPMTICVRGAVPKEVAIHFDAVDFSEDFIRKTARVCDSP